MKCAATLLILILTFIAPFAFSDESEHTHHQEMSNENSASNKDSDDSNNQASGHDMMNMEKISGKPTGPKDCSEMEVWDYGMAMCMPLPMAGMPMKMLMVHGNSFFMQTAEQGPRGRSAFTIPDMFMADIGSSVGDHHYFNLDFMGTFEKWTYSSNGTPELLQIGEDQANGQPFLDAQHPHSSPVMGLTLSDTISFGRGTDHAKIWFAPRGESTDGPVAFMHRPTGMVNPDAPLGHHIGQDVGHISSTVIGASTRLGNTNFEVSTFNGTEPSPTAVDLPLGSPNSYAARIIEQFSPNLYAMASATFVKSPEISDPTLDHVWRYSASAYLDTGISNGWTFDDALIWGLINDYDNASALNSFAEEFWIHKDAQNIWGRLEVVQRTPAELKITGLNDINSGRWVTALTLGYTRRIMKIDELEMGFGGSIKADFLPPEYQSSYGGTPLSGQVFVQIGGMKMWNL